MFSSGVSWNDNPAQESIDLVSSIFSRFASRGQHHHSAEQSAPKSDCLLALEQ